MDLFFTRRTIYSFYATSGNGFEAFLSDSGTLTIAVACKKEFLVKNVFPLNF